MIKKNCNKRFLVFGQETFYYLWDDDYNNLAQVILNGNGTVITINDKQDNSDIIQKCLSEFKVYKEITKDNFNILNSRLKLFSKI